MRLLGLSAYHADASGALVRDGELVAAAEEERFRRVKHRAGLPSRAAGGCLKEDGLALSDVDVVALNRVPRVNLLRKGLYTLRCRPSPGLVWHRLRNLGKVESVAGRLGGRPPGSRRPRGRRLWLRGGLGVAPPGPPGVLLPRVAL